MQRVPALISQRLEVALGAEAPRTSLRSAAWQSAMRKLWAMENGAVREKREEVQSAREVSSENGH